MKSERPLKPTDSAIRAYYVELEAYARQGVLHEGAVSSAFQRLLAECARRRGWVLIPQLGAPGDRHNVPDGTVRDENSLPRGYWEAKDSHDDLTAEIAKKIARGYPLTNTIFEDTRQAILYQNKQPTLEADLQKAAEVAGLLNQFLTYRPPDIAGFEEAVEEFKEHVPDLARGLNEKIKEAHHSNKRFVAAFDTFFHLCQTALNPNIRREAVDEMLIQHLLTERLIGTIFDKPEFVQQNVIAAEVEKVVSALVSQSFSRKDYLKSLDRFYLAIESAARTLPDFSDKQHFLNTVYERFFQGYSVKVADTHGIVYTPQPIVDFMCASVAEVLQREFGRSLSSSDVFIIDPCTGTGNFIVNLLRRMSRRDLPRVYREQMFANEVMLLPYYIAALNVEHAYYELTGGYEPFEGLCFVDTLGLAEGSQSKLGFMTETNTQRVARQKQAPITVVIGNPPYNMNQQNENDNNKNRKYPVIERRVSETYAKASRASNKNALSDPYVKFFRWATDRLEGRDGIVSFVSNNSFVDQYAFDGMRKHLLQDFTEIYHVDLHGNVRRNPKLSGTTHNVFGIQVGVGITVAVRKKQVGGSTLRYFRVPEDWRKEEKLGWLVGRKGFEQVQWNILVPDAKNSWVAIQHAEEYASFIPIASKEAKSGESASPHTMFKLFSVGVKTNRDEVVYDFQRQALISRVRQFVEEYNSELDRYKRSGKGSRVDDFVRYEKIKWSRDIKLDLKRGNYASFDDSKVRLSLYRAFCRRWLFFDRILNEEVYGMPSIFPTDAAETENRLICCTIDSQMPFSALLTDVIPSHAPGGRPGQCFPFYVYSEAGSSRRENITDWTLEQFRKHYEDETIAKWDIFHYVYGVLHHPVYRERFAENLRRELPRIPFLPDFLAVRDIGTQLADLHINYETLEPYPLQWIENPSVPLSYRVEDKMRLSKDERSVRVNHSLTLAGIPLETLQYRLGNRSALEWAIDQYQVAEHYGIRSDPNRADDEQYIVRLVGQIVRVSLETVRLVSSLPLLAAQPAKEDN